MRPQDIAQYLQQRREQIGRSTRRVRDFSVFEFDYVPEAPLMRVEAQQLIDDMLRFELTAIPINYVCIGSRGSGKTISMRYLQKIVTAETALKVHYANCRQHNTSFKILAHLLGVQARGAGLAELFESYLAACAGKTVVVLDEVDLMSPKDPRREILYLLSRCGRPFMVLMLSNSPHVLKQLDAATRSSLQPVPLHFRNYNAEQIRQILEMRAERGLAAGESAPLAEIAALTARHTNADARVAIKTLFYTVTQPERSLTDAFERARRDIVIDLIQDLSDATLLILWAAVSASTDLARPIYERYVRLCRDRSEKPFSYMHFTSNLAYLQSVGLVALLSTKVGRTYTNRVALQCDPAIAAEICRLRFGG